MCKLDKLLACLNKYICCYHTNKYEFDSNNYIAYEYNQSDYVTEGTKYHKNVLKPVPYSNSQMPSNHKRQKKYNKYSSHNSYRQFDSARF